MINLFLKLKSWQLFLIIVLLPTVLFLSFGSLSVFSFSIYSLHLLWIYSIANFFSSHLSPKPKYLNLSFIVSLLYIIYYSFYAISYLQGSQGSQTTFLSHFSIQLIFMVAFIYLIYQAAEGIRSAELNRKVFFRDTLTDFFCILFFPIGLWLIQPRVIKYYNSKEDIVNTEQKSSA